MKLAKYHGLGNDFLIRLDLDAPRLESLSRLAQTLCDRRTGIGADGFICCELPTLRMHLYNSDGSRAAISGNGLRCLGHAVSTLRLAAGHVDIPDTLAIETDAGARRLEVIDIDITSQRAELAVEMGTPQPGPDYDQAKIASIMGNGSKGLRTETVNIGNPHLVIDVTGDALPDPAEKGPTIEAQFDDGINVEWIRRRADDHIDLVVWERGAGVTQACGSGATAAAYQARVWNLVGDHARVSMPGGDVSVKVEEGETWLIGPSVFVASIEIDVSDP